MPSSSALAQGLDLLEETLRGAKLSPLARGAYARALRDLDDAEWRRCVDEAIATCTFVPTPHELLALTRGNVSDAARAGWDLVEASMRRLGRYESVDFGPAINAAVRHVGGWGELCTGDLVNVVHRRREFIAALEGYLRGGVPAGRGEYLPGELEQSEVAKLGAFSGVVHRLGPGAERTPEVSAGRRRLQLVDEIASRKGIER